MIVRYGYKNNGIIVGKWNSFSDLFNDMNESFYNEIISVQDLKDELNLSNEVIKQIDRFEDCIILKVQDDEFGNYHYILFTRNDVGKKVENMSDSEIYKEIFSNKQFRNSKNGLYLNLIEIDEQLIDDNLCEAVYFVTNEKLIEV